MTSRIQEPMLTKALDLSRGKPKEATSVGAYDDIVADGAMQLVVRITWGIRRQLVSYDSQYFLYIFGVYQAHQNIPHS